MINFFRRIRFDLMDKNKTGKYLKYAIGEIVLVVIGILIALQINNWNEHRILLKKEKQYLNEIAVNLQADILRIKDIFKFNRIKDSVLDETIDPLLEYKADSIIAGIIAKNFDRNSTFNVFEQHRAGYSNMLQAESIGLIQNDSLRQKLTNYYQQEEELKNGTALRIKELTREFADISTNLILNKTTITQIIGKDNNWPLDIELTRENKTKLLSYLINIKDNVSFYTKRLERLDEEVLELRNSIIGYLDD